MAKIKKRLEKQENPQGLGVLLLFMGNLEELPYAERLCEELNKV